jgi:hypothetical protein
MMRELAPLLAEERIAVHNHPRQSGAPRVIGTWPQVVDLALSKGHDGPLAYGAMAVCVRGAQVPGAIMHTDCRQQGGFRVACGSYGSANRRAARVSAGQRGDRAMAHHAELRAALTGTFSTKAVAGRCGDKR